MYDPYRYSFIQTSLQILFNILSDCCVVQRFDTLTLHNLICKFIDDEYKAKVNRKALFIILDL